MQWSPDRNAGFSKANPQSLFLPVIIDPEYHYELVNVETLEHNTSSFLWWMRRLLAAYKAEPALGRGGMRFVRGENPKVLALLRSDGENRLLAVINLSRHAQVAELDLANLAGFTPVDVFGQTRFPVIGREPYVLTMGAFGYFWFRLENGHGPQNGETEDACLLLDGAEARSVCDLDVLSEPGGHVLPPALDRIVERLTHLPAGAVAQIDELTLDIPSGTASLILAENQDRQGDPANHFLVVTRLREHGPEDRDVNPEAVLARLTCPDGARALVNGLRDSGSLAALALFMASGKRRRTGAGVFHGELLARRCDRTLLERLAKARVITRNPQSMTFSLDNAVFLKVFLRPEEGVNPDLELPQLLARRGFSAVPRVLAALNYRRPRTQPTTLAVATTYVAGAVTGEAFALEALERFFGEVVAEGVPPGPEIPGEVIGEYVLENFRSLGRLAGRMHLTLAGTTEPDFAPEPVTKLYLRSIYQAMRNHVHRVALAVDEARRDDPGLKPLPRRVLLERFSRLLTLTPGGSRIRIHGDLQLENVLRSGHEVLLTDFDGDVRLPLGERRIKRSPLRDVASLLFSTAVAARRGLAVRLAHAPSEVELLSDWLARWLEAVCESCIAAYQETVGEADFLPSDDTARRVLLYVFVLEQGLRSILRALEDGRREVPLLLAAMESLRSIAP